MKNSKRPHRKVRAFSVSKKSELQTVGEAVPYNSEFRFLDRPGNTY